MGVAILNYAMYNPLHQNIIAALVSSIKKFFVSNCLISIVVSNCSIVFVFIVTFASQRTVQPAAFLDENVSNSLVYTAAMMEDFVRLFREALSKVGPEPGVASPYR